MQEKTLKRIRALCERNAAYLCVRFLICVCVDLWRMEEHAEASTATAAERADARRHVHVGEQTRGRGGEDHQTQSSVCR